MDWIPAKDNDEDEDEDERIRLLEPSSGCIYMLAKELEESNRGGKSGPWLGGDDAWS